MKFKLNLITLALLANTGYTAQMLMLSMSYKL